MHGVQQLRAGVGIAAEPVLALAVVEGRIDIASVRFAPGAHEFQHRVGLRPACLGPHAALSARVHQRVRGARHEAVVDEEVFLDRQLGVAPFQVTRAVAADAVAQRQVLRPRRGADGVGLHETQFGDGLGQRRRLEEAAGDRVGAQCVDGDDGLGHRLQTKCWLRLPPPDALHCTSARAPLISTICGGRWPMSTSTSTGQGRVPSVDCKASS